jgi:hypothetical protein
MDAFGIEVRLRRPDGFIEYLASQLPGFNDAS